MPVEITQKKKPRNFVVQTRVDEDAYAEIKRITFAVGQSQQMFLKDAIADRLLYLQGYLNDKEDGHV